MTITVRYSCPLCGLSRVECDVPARGDEDVVAWMEHTIALLGRDHAKRSPACHPERLHDLRIPMTGTDRVGGPTRH